MPHLRSLPNRGYNMRIDFIFRRKLIDFVRLEKFKTKIRKWIDVLVLDRPGRIICLQKIGNLAVRTTLAQDEDSSR